MSDNPATVSFYCNGRRKAQREEVFMDMVMVVVMVVVMMLNQIHFSLISLNFHMYDIIQLMSFICSDFYSPYHI